MTQGNRLETAARDRDEAEGSGLGGPLVDAVADWLMTRALADTPMETLMRGCCERLAAAGIPLTRGHIGFRTLHPLFEAATVTWRRDGELQTIQIPHADADQQAWQQSPHKWMIDRNVLQLRRRLIGREAQLDFPVLEDFRIAGATDYLAYLVPFEQSDPTGTSRMGIIGSWLTDRESGFSDADVRALMRIQQRLAVASKVTVKDQISRNILAAYLGISAGEQVLDGHIKLGDGQTVHAVIWYNDLRDSTAMADRLPPAEFLDLLNDYFECTAGSVLAHGGKVLRFVGDAVLAIFPIEGEGGDAAACERAIAAATESRRRLKALNEARTADGRNAIQFGLGLHLGDLIFGNIGVPERVEFSVIGPAANEVARLDSLTKEIGQPVLATALVAAHHPNKWRSLGAYPLRGIGAPMDVFALILDEGSKT
jgi:adenylate cyclase